MESSESSLDVLVKLSEFFAILKSSNLACLDLEEVGVDICTVSDLRNLVLPLFSIAVL